MKPIGCLVASAALALVPFAAHAQADASGYPSKPVRLFVGFTPGSATDVTARLLAQKLNEAWGVTVTVDNVPGAGGTIGSARAAKSAPDGYTLLSLFEPGPFDHPLTIVRRVEEKFRRLSPVQFEGDAYFRSSPLNELDPLGANHCFVITAL